MTERTRRPGQPRFASTGRLLAAATTAIVFGAALILSGPRLAPVELVVLVLAVSAAMYVLWALLEARLRSPRRKLVASADYGPNARDVARFHERIARMTLEEARLLGTLEGGPDEEARSVARGALREAAEATGRADALHAAQAAVTAAGTAWYRGSIISTFAMDTDLADTIGAAMPALLDAAGALVARDLLRSEHFDALHGPWAAVMEADKGDPSDRDPP